ncbi:flavodoxin family protein [Streptomyces beihaiensis]|uniref:Flavodoxin family protein n=1 Tax=Streptomyces beihaiensis TaxID=2984495 RepID=A0ABT3TXJ5_9ACTN|nr:flavodoxin family protein [Streptomyces beihaiensis]MCX3061763.1 flavodoxin family protein [Streptomyces beihaiensis]
MKALIVCVSVSHGNTWKVADAMGRVLDASVVAPEDVDPGELAGYDLVGIGSGIFRMAFHPRLRDFVQGLPRREEERPDAFVFSTSGLPEAPFRPYTRPLVRVLEEKGFPVVGAFSCRAWDTWAPFKPVGGIRKGRPDEDDLAEARLFARGVRARFGSAT